MQTASEAGAGVAPITLESALEAVIRRVVREELAQLQPKATDAPTLTYKQASEACGLPETHLREAVARGDLAACKLGVRTVRIRRDDLARYLERRRCPAKDEPVSVKLRRVAGGVR